MLKLVDEEPVYDTKLVKNQDEIKKALDDQANEIVKDDKKKMTRQGEGEMSQEEEVTVSVEAVNVNKITQNKADDSFLKRVVPVKQRKHACPNCNKRFENKSKLMRHINDRHEKTQQFSCPRCSRMFTQKGNLMQHKALHYDVSPLRVQCKKCKKIFSTKGGLKKHEKTAHGYDVPKILSCDFCGYATPHRTTLRRHVTGHQTLDATTCVPCTFEGCTGIFRNQDDVNKHESAVHSGN